MTALRLLLCAIFLTSLGSIHQAGVNAVPGLEIAEPDSDKCWIFLHLPKAGGSTVKHILSKHFVPRYAVYAENNWEKGGEFLQSFAQTLADGDEWDVVAGGYSEALRLSGVVPEKCKWFTTFRHPISRMVSAYYYCKTKPSDTLCATSIMSARNTDLATFAKHWSNYAMRQFALSMVPVDDVIEYSRTDAMRERLPRTPKNPENIPGWYLLKRYLDDRVWMSEHVQTPDAAMYEMLAPVQDVIRDKYTVGILEEFNATLSLFDAALGMPGLDWHKQYNRAGKHNVNNQYAEEIKASLADAWTNSEIKKYMQLDLLLYEQAVDVFGQQTRAYGIER